MANVNIDVGEGSLLVYKGIDFDFAFNISVPMETEDDLTIKEYMFEHSRDMITKSEYMVKHLKKDWIRVDNFEVDENELNKILNVNGIPKAKFKYKVEFLNTSGQVIQVLKDYSTNYISINDELYPYSYCINCGEKNEIQECLRCGVLYPSEYGDENLCSYCFDKLEKE